MEATAWLCAMMWACAGWAGPWRVQGAQSACNSHTYRELPVEVQNEHQCMVLERLHQEVVDRKTQGDTHFAQLISRMDKVEHSLSRKLRRINRRSNVNIGRGFPSLRGVPIARDCNELWMSGIRLSGVYAVKIPSGLVLNVFCDMDTVTNKDKDKDTDAVVDDDDGGGWTVIQRRLDGSLNFSRKWDDYAFGFGNVNGEFWLGNENLHSMTKGTNYTLRITLWDWEDRQVYAQYSFMRVGSEAEDYRLQIGSYSGTAGDSLSYHNGMRFTTPDRDHDLWWANCGRKDRSGWWFNACSHCSLNGVYQHLEADEQGENRTALRPPSPDGTQIGIHWFQWKSDPAYSLRGVDMKLKPKAAVMLEKRKRRAKRRREKQRKSDGVNG